MAGSYSIAIGNSTGTPSGLISEGVVSERGSFTDDLKLRSVNIIKHEGTSSGTVRAVVYADDGSLIAQGSDLAVTSSQAAGTVLEAAFDSPVDLTSGTVYRIGVYQSANITRARPGAAQHSHSSSPSGYSWDEFNTKLYYIVGSQAFPTSEADYELEGSFGFDPAALTASLTPVTETDTAQPVGRTKRKAIATVTETDTAPVFTRQKSKALEPALETDTTPAIETGGIRVAIATVTETDEAPAITRTDPSTFLYRLTFPTYPRSFQTVPIGQTVRFVLDQAVSIVRVNGTLRDFRSPSQTQLQAAGEEGRDWFIGGRIYEQIPNDVAAELRLAGFETERVT